MNKEMLKSYWSNIHSQCSFYSPQNPSFLAGEILSQFSRRRSLRREMAAQEAELAKLDGVLSGLLFQMKKRLSRLGRNGGWSKWLQQERIPRSLADRLCLEHAEFFNLGHELSHRKEREPLEGNLCQAAHRSADRLENLLKSSKSKMTYLRVLADRLGLAVEYDDTLDSVRLAIPSPQETVGAAPAIIEMQPDGSVRPVNHELREEGAGDAVL
ncbi:hypothetical protein [Occallatibacter savannae]|uniref:hypothetical protein n=1 Tax=Occallatibacter savannae TaxID=1002691 RepID=UPI000D686BE2|nr:hypothetical protein [Occallatibacter savannae]